MSLSIRAIGPYTGVSGYDSMTRGFAEGLVGLGARLELVPVAGWSPELRSGASRPSLRAQTGGATPDVVVHFMMPDRCRPLAGLPSVNFTMFEAERIPDAWVEHAEEHDLVILPTETCREAWERSGVPSSKLRVCGLGVNGEFLGQAAEPLRLLVHGGRPVASYGRRFLHVGELRPRKNHLSLVRTWIQATNSNDDAILVVKCLAPPALMVSFQRDLARMQEDLGRGLPDAAPVLFVNEQLDDHEMRALYRSATHYISMSHGEGWDMPMMEAAAAGLSLLAPDQPTYRAYLGQEDADWLPCTMVPARIEGQAGAEDLDYFRGLKWWQPEEDVAVELVARIIASREARPPPTGQILSEFSWARASQRLLDTLYEFFSRGNG